MSIAPYITVHKKDADGNYLYDGAGNPVMGVVINPVKPFVRGYWIPGVNPQNGIATALAPFGSAKLDFIIDSQGDFDWAYLVGVSTGAYVVSFIDVGKNRNLSNVPIHSSLIVGSGQRPFKLPEPYFLNVGASQRNVQCIIRDISGAPNTVRLAMYGRRFYTNEADPDVSVGIRRALGEGERCYSYFLAPLESDQTTGAPPVCPPLGTQVLTLQSDAGSDTELTKLMAASTGPFSVRILDQSKNKFLQSDTVHSNMQFGNAEFPFILADSFLLERQKFLIFQITDLSGAPNTIYLAGAGKRLTFRP